MRLHALLYTWLLVESVSAFVPASKIVRHASPLMAFTPAGRFDENNGLLSRAFDCSLSETCSVEEAEWYASQINTIQSTCSADRSALDSEICDHEEDTTRVLALLIEKIQNSNVAIATKEGSSASLAENVALAAVLLLLTATILTTNFGGEATTAFTLEEWWWSVRDNYFPLLVIHFIKDGGLIL